MVFFCSDLLFLKIIVIVLGKDSRIVLEALVNESQPIDTSQRSRIRDRSEWKSYDQEHISIWFIIYFIQPWAGNFVLIAFFCAFVGICAFVTNFLCTISIWDGLGL